MVSLPGPKSKKKRKLDVVAVKDENKKKKFAGELPSIKSSIPSRLSYNKVQMKLLFVSSKDIFHKLSKSNLNKGKKKKKKYVSVTNNTYLTLIQAQPN